MVVKALLLGARRCTTGAVLLERAGMCTAGTAACDDSFNVEIPIFGDGGVTSFCQERARRGGLGCRTLM